MIIINQNSRIKLVMNPRIDLTTLFKSCVKTIKTRNKTIGISSPITDIFPKKSDTNFFNRGKDILENITSHDKLLLDHKKKYLLDNSQSSHSYSDTDRACLDKVVSKNLKIIEDNIRSLELDLREEPNDALTSQAKECYLCTINILRSKYLKTSANFRDMKDARQRKQKAKERLLVLQRPGGPKKQYEKLKSVSRTKSDLEQEDELKKSQTNFEEDNRATDILKVTNTANEDSNKNKTCVSYMDHEIEEVLSGLNEDEKQMLEEENFHLHQELLSNHEEVKQITKQVVELSRMQDVLTENVEIQAQQIEEIHDTILVATDNVQRGNEQVREAMRNNAGFRVWIIFFLIVMSCSLLFLDWYNP